MRKSVILLAALVLAAACKDDDQSKATSPEPKGEITAPSGPAKQLVKQNESADSVRTEVKQGMAQWLAAQNEFTFDRYIAMYHPKHFKGVKRTTRGTKKELRYAGWKADRGRMFKNKPVVAADDIEITTWLDPGVNLKNGISKVRFTQRWKTKRYADHGTKVIRWWRDPKGVHHIIYEDLLNAERGWKRSLAAAETGIDWKPIKSDEEAIAIWTKLAPTGANYTGKLAAIPEDPDIERPLARALLSGQDFACDAVIQYGECGEEGPDLIDPVSQEWAPLPASATLSSPCLRRRLAPWAIARLAKSDGPRVREALIAMMALPEPESELPKAALAYARTLGDEPLLFEMFESAVQPGRKALVDDEAVPKSILKRTASELKLSSAIRSLDASHNDLLAELLLDDEVLVVVRRGIPQRLEKARGPKIDDALKQAAASSECQLAIRAAEVLAARGDRSMLPKWSASMLEDELTRALCMLSHESDRKRANKAIKGFIGKGVTLTSIEVMQDHEAQAVPESDLVSKADFNTQALRDEVPEWGFQCDGQSCEAGPSDRKVTLRFSQGNGGLVLAEIHVRHWSGCGC